VTPPMIRGEMTRPVDPACTAIRTATATMAQGRSTVSAANVTGARTRARVRSRE
jgi:hypothetical protein